MAEPLRWIGRACRVSGPERGALVQSAKATAAAMAAWVVAAHIFEFPQPFLAPWAALFIVEATVYRSVCSAAQQVCAVVVAVLLASAAAAVLPWELFALGVAVLVGLLIGQWRVFGDSGAWIGVTAMLILTTGTMDDTLLIDRLVETLIGVSIGLVVNMLVFAPSYRSSSADANRRLALHVAETVEAIAQSLRDGSAEQLAMSGRTLPAIDLLRRAETAVELDEESRKLNPRVVAGLAMRHTGDDSALEALRTMWTHVEAMGRTVESATADRGSFALPDDTSKHLLSEGLAGLAHALRLWADGAERDEWTSVLRSADDTIAELESPPASSKGAPATPGLAAITVPARLALSDAAGLAVSLTQARP
jgi:uncharacterized membrane protein YgaE (UPF0421/DUF939 family)